MNTIERLQELRRALGVLLPDLDHGPTLSEATTVMNEIRRLERELGIQNQKDRT